MFKTVLVVSALESFTVRGIETRLGEKGFVVTYSSPKIKELQEACPVSDLIVLHTDENVASEADALVYLKDFCLERDQPIVVVGSKLEYDIVLKYIPKECIQLFFKRPLDMKRFLDKVEDALSDEAQHERKKSILVVGDDISYMEMVSEWLEGKYRVSTVNSGVKAITYLANNHADLILLDYEMSTSPQVIKMIRSEPEMCEVPVILLTGVADQTGIEKLKALNPTDFYMKAAGRQGLKDMVDIYFLTRRSGE